jgi:metallo-beta-lactamase class B
MSKMICIKFLLFLFIISVSVSAQERSEILLNSDLMLIPLSENVYLHRSYKEYPSGRFGSNGLILITGNQAIMIDTPVNDSLTAQLLKYFSDQGIDFRAVIPTHWHDDCLGGLNAAHQAGIESYGLNLTLKLAKEHGYVPPEIGFDDSLTFDLEGKTVECSYLGAGHSRDNIVVWIPSEKVLFGGCLVKALSARGLGNIADADIAAWPLTIKRVMDKYPNARYVIPGHGDFGGLELLDHTLNLLTSP